MRSNKVVLRKGINVRITFVTYGLTSLHSGVTISIMEYCNTLKKLGHQPSIVSLFADPDTRRQLSELGIDFQAACKKRPFLYELRLISYSRSLAKKMMRLIDCQDLAEAYVVYADEATPLVRLRNNSTWIYIFQGDWSLLFLFQSFIDRYPFASRLLSFLLSRAVRNHAKLVRSFDAVASNSEFSGLLASFLYDYPFTKTIYPPLQDRLNIKPPVPVENRGAYFVAVLRNEHDNEAKFICELSSHFRIKVIGGARVQGCENLGFLSSDEFDNIVGRALAYLAPSNTEYFGRVTIESLALGTPVIAYDNCGAKEIISDFGCGWLEANKKSFMSRMANVLENKYDNAMIQNCIRRSHRFNSLTVTKEMIDWIIEAIALQTVV